MAWKGVFETDTLSRCEVDGEHDVLDFLVRDAVDIDIARQPAS